jgi:uncharacterized OB-fold protein
MAKKKVAKKKVANDRHYECMDCGKMFHENGAICPECKSSNTERIG